MKKIAFLTILMFAVAAMYGQRTETITTSGADTAVVTLTQPTKISILATQLGGTTDGTLTLEGSVDGTTFTKIEPTAGAIYYFVSDTSELTGYTWTLASAASFLATFEKPYFDHVRVRCEGTSGDTTTLTIKWAK